MKVQIHETTLEGKPVNETGRVLRGENAGEIVEAMKQESPFTACLTEREYIDGVLSKIMPYEESTELDATKFLTKLAEKGFISFIPDDETLPAMTTEVAPCADKQG